MNKNKPSLKPVDTQERLLKLEQQQRKREEDVKLKELEKLEIRFKRKSSAKTKKIDDPQQKLLEKILNNTNKVPESTTSKRANSRIKTIPNNKNEVKKVESNEMNIMPHPSASKKSVLVEDSEFRKTFKNEKIEIDCDTSRNIETPKSRATNKNNEELDYNNDKDYHILNNSINENDIEDYIEVYRFLESLGLQNKYFNTFLQNEFLDMQSILLLENKHLDEMYIHKNAQAKILNKIKELRGSKPEKNNIVKNDNNRTNNFDKKGECGVGTENTNSISNKIQSNENFYDEEKQRLLFQQAVMEFRNGGKTENNDFKIESEKQRRINLEKEYLKKEKDLVENSPKVLKLNNYLENIIDK